MPNNVQPAKCQSDLLWQLRTTFRWILSIVEVRDMMGLLKGVQIGVLLISCSLIKKLSIVIVFRITLIRLFTILALSVEYET